MLYHFFHQFHSPFYQLLQFSKFCLLWDFAVHATLKIFPDTYCVILLLCLTSSNESFLNTRKCLKFTQRFTWISSPFRTMVLIINQKHLNLMHLRLTSSFQPSSTAGSCLSLSSITWVPRNSFGLTSKSEQCVGWAHNSQHSSQGQPSSPSPFLIQHLYAASELLPSINSACWTLYATLASLSSHSVCRNM